MLAEALEHLVRGIVDNPEDVSVRSATTAAARRSRCACTRMIWVA